MKYTILSEPLFTHSDPPGPDLPSFLANSEPLDREFFRGQPWTSGNESTAGFKKPFFYSLLVHMILILSLTLGVYSPDRRPVKEVNHWVVDPVTGLKAEPKGPQKDLAAIQNMNPPPSRPVIKREPQLRFKNEIPFPARVTDPKEVPGIPAMEEIKESPAQVEKPIEAAKESLNQQVQAGPYRLVMRLPPPIAAAGVKHFYQNVHEHTLRLLEGSVPEEKRNNLREKRAAVELFYNPDGTIQKVLTTSESSPDLAEILQDKIQWNSLAPPFQFGLPNRAVKLQIGIDDSGKFNLHLDLL